MTTQIAVKISEELLARVDELVAQGAFRSRSAAVRKGLEVVLIAQKRRVADRAIRDAFRKIPETDQEMQEAYGLAVEAIHDEPWDKWW